MSDDLMPERIWIKPCSPCDHPDAYYVCDPRYLDGHGTSYIKSDIRCAGCNGGLYRRGNTMICRDCGKAEEWPDVMGRADTAHLRAEVERLRAALADERRHADALAEWAAEYRQAILAVDGGGNLGEKLDRVNQAVEWLDDTLVAHRDRRQG